jgi:hypothetical protein
MSDAIVGELSIIAGDGTELTDRTDIGLAWQWAKVEVDARLAEFPGGWEVLTYGQQCEHVSGALAALRSAYRKAN